MKADTARLIAKALIIPTLIITLAMACTPTAHRQKQAEIAKSAGLIPVSRVAILPTVAQGDNGNGTLPENLQTGVETMDRLLADYFAENDKAILVTPDREEAIIAHAMGNREALARDVARNLNCDAVLLSTLTRYQKRQGSRYSVNQPASVSFELKLLATDSGQILYSTLFQETQQSLTSNILNFGRAAARGFKWISAEDLTREGLFKKLKASPYFRHDRQPNE